MKSTLLTKLFRAEGYVDVPALVASSDDQFIKEKVYNEVSFEKQRYSFEIFFSRASNFHLDNFSM